MYMFFVHYILLYGLPGDIEYPNLLKIKGLSDVLWEYTKKMRWYSFAEQVAS